VRQPAPSVFRGVVLASSVLLAGAFLLYRTGFIDFSHKSPSTSGQAQRGWALSSPLERLTLRGSPLRTAGGAPPRDEVVAQPDSIQRWVLMSSSKTGAIFPRPGSPTHPKKEAPAADTLNSLLANSVMTPVVPDHKLPPP
jgi:hypothetical protein